MTSIARCARRISVVGLLVLTAAVGAASSAVAQTGGGGGPGAMRVLGGVGKLTGRSGSTLELEGFTGTTKVIVTSSTKYRQTEDTDATAITKGACIRVSGDGDTTKAFDATSVSVLDRADMCKAQRATRSGDFPDGGQGPEGRQLPEGGALPNGGSLPNGASRPEGAFGGGVTGTVTSVAGDTVVVSARVPKQTSNGDAPPKLVKRTVKVTLTDSTTVTHTVDATDRVLVVGTCLSSEGSTDSVGTVTAKTVTASQPDGNGDCTGAFGGFVGGPASSSGPI
jgi:hypothetical protein